MNNEHPILFSADMVKAILDGRKTQTRRVMKPTPCGYDPSLNDDDKWEFCCDLHNEDEENNIHVYKCPYGQVGDRLWVREIHWGYGKYLKGKFQWAQKMVVQYEPPELKLKRTQFGWHKRPSIHMPRWASRITLEITNIRVERVQEISEEDAIAEGIERIGNRFKGYMRLFDGKEYDPALAATSYSQLWDSINGKRKGCSWDDNPYVWVVTFKQIH